MKKLRKKLIVGYKGTNYNGFARQAQDKVHGSGTRTISAEIEMAIKKITREEVKVIGAGRTDSGVHALGQVCLIDIRSQIGNFGLRQAINNKLPKDIVIKSIEDVNEEFHPTFSAKSKRYRYQILNSEIRCPFKSDVVYYYPYKLDLEKMREAAQELVGTHDFRAFCAAKSSVLEKGTSTVRTIFDIEIEKNEEEIITIMVVGNGFLYNMVRIIVGTLIDKGRDRGIAIKEIIECKERKYAGKTVPASGLTMIGVEY